MKYTPVIGLEVHVELKTLSKMFCGCSNNWFGEKPNTHTCPVCLGLPGALPFPNKKAIEWCVMIGMALNCEIPLTSKFDRKNYFYPDLSKGYQISQYDQPFSVNGWINIKSQDTNPKIQTNTKKIRIRRVHMEEDTGKLIHETIDGEKVSLIDFNRSGVPLVEIVTEPDFENAAEVKEYLQKLQQVVRYLDVSNADMEKGEMRLEPNISLNKVNTKKLPKYKVEVKNINSFSFVERAINFEIGRQTEILEKGKIPNQETRGWDEDKKVTISQRNKEEASDYRYFPDPDIPPIIWSKETIEKLRSRLPESPNKKIERLIKEYGLTDYNSEIIARTKELADYFEESVKVGSQHKIQPEKIANIIINKKINTEETLPAQLVQQILQSQQVSGISEEELENVLKKVLVENENVVVDYKKGKTNALMFLVGQAMKELKGKAKAETVREKLEKMLQ